jgi:uncharacterized protein (DUF427 family)
MDTSNAPDKPEAPRPASGAATPDHVISVEASAKRVRVMFNGRTIADSLGTVLLFETRHRPVYYFPRQDVRLDLLERNGHRTHCPYKGDAAYWTIAAGSRRAENAVWSYEEPLQGMSPIRGRLAFYWDRVDHWFEEDEEIFGHARDPRHRVDVLPSSREVRVVSGGEEIARSRRALFLFETGMPTRYYLPPEDVRSEFLQPSRHRTTCPYKGHASYWSIRVRNVFCENAVWAYCDPLPECPRIRGRFCFYPEKVERIEVEGEAP